MSVASKFKHYAHKNFRRLWKAAVNLSNQHVGFCEWKQGALLSDASLEEALAKFT